MDAIRPHQGYAKPAVIRPHQGYAKPAEPSHVIIEPSVYYCRQRYLSNSENKACSLHQCSKDGEYEQS